MPLAITPVGQIKDVPAEAPKIYNERYKHSIVDSAYQPETSLLSMVDGAPRMVEFYHQFLGQTEEPLPFQPEGMALYQSYTRIKRMIIKQEGDGAYNYDPDTGQSAKEYNGYVIFDLTPIRGDVFIADIGDGNAGLFVLTEQPEIRNFTANKVYYITYKLVSFLTEQMFDALNKRVVKELVYSKDSAMNGGNAVISEGAYDDQKNLMKWLITITGHLYRNFYWNPEKTFALITQGEQKVYDQYLVEFLCAVTPPELRQGYPFINRLSTQYGGREVGYHGSLSIWDVLLRGDFHLLGQCSNRIGIVDVNRLYATRAYGTIRNSKFDQVLVTDPENYGNMQPYFNMDGYPILTYDADRSTTYMFTAEFYKGQASTEIEHLVLDILRDRVIDRKRLLKYCDTYFNLTRWEQLYYGAILILLIQATRKVDVGV